MKIIPKGTIIWVYFFSRSRVIRLDKRADERLGLKIDGGNCVGIYVTGFLKQSLAEEAGVRIGDRLLQVRDRRLPLL